MAPNMATELPSATYEDIVSSNAENDSTEFSTVMEASTPGKGVRQYGGNALSSEREAELKKEATELVAVITRDKTLENSAELNKILEDIRQRGTQEISRSSGEGSPLLRATVLVKSTETLNTESQKDIIDLQDSLSGKKRGIQRFTQIIPRKLEKNLLSKVMTKQDAINATREKLEEHKKSIVTSASYMQLEMGKISKIVSSVAENAYFMWELDRQLREYVKNKSAENENLTKQEFQNKYDAVFARVRKRYNDLAVHTLALLQSIVAIDTTLAINNDIEDNLNRTLTTSMNLIETAEMIETAQRSQKHALETSRAVRSFAEDALIRNAQGLAQNVAESRAQSAETVVNLDKLEEAWATTIQALHDAKQTNEYVANEAGKLQGRLTEMVAGARPLVREISQ